MSFFDKLPQELLTDICTRLPIKIIVRTTCVCKSFHALIKNPNFTAHINQTVADDKTRSLLLMYHSDHDFKEGFLIRCDDETFDECMRLDNSYKIWPLHDDHIIVGSCNGLICLYDDFSSYSGVHILWNPAIRKSFILPLPPSGFSTQVFVLGFGFNSWTNDFKVVRIVYTFTVPPQVEVYELSTGLWRVSSAVVPLNGNEISGCSSHVFVKGACHWVAFEKGREQNRHLIISFDMGSEVFREMMPPASVANGPDLNMSISLFGELLSLFHYDGASSGESKRCCIWVMKEYGVMESWTKLFTVDLGGEIDEVLGFRKTGEVLVAKDQWVVSYDPESKQEVNLRIRWSPHSFHLDTYMESLVLLDGKDQVSLNQA
ncbi:F-box protein At3g07870-like isoform X2 [Cornus florida]|uniref:F-box protein At3g07870-like isoform X2 n=1 Tax=Cornus florida TaxID=4283 RepID=UPI00289EB876|nr:F-box protein At3g07870-like isoform X2 [Cornus florida]